MKWVESIKRNPFYFSVLLLSAAFIFSRLPFFIWFAVPEILPDTFDYFNVVDILLRHPVSDLSRQPIELPLGYPIFLLAVGGLSNKLITIVVMQSAIKFLSCLYLTYVSCRYYKKYGIPLALAMCFYLMNSFTLRWDTCLYSESIYSSALIFLIALFIRALNENSLTSWLWLGIWLFVPGFIRPNGMYVYLLIPIACIFLFVHRQRYAKYLMLIVPVMFLNIAWATFNITAYGKFIPGNFIRFTGVMERNTSNTENSKRAGLEERLNDYIHLKKAPEFYSSMWPVRYQNIFIRKQALDTTIKMYDNTIPVTEHLRRMVYKEFYGSPDNFAACYDQTCNGAMVFWLRAYRAWHGIEEIIQVNLLLFIIFIIITVYSGVKWGLSRFKSPVYFLVFVVGFLHLSSILFVAISHPVAQYRYIQVSEFMVYLSFALAPLLVKRMDESLNAE